MVPQDKMNPFMKELVARLCGNNTDSNKGNSNNQGKNNSACKLNITPSQALVIAGLIGGALTVDSVLVDRNQEVQIVLIGSLKQETELEKIMDQIGKMPFDEVLKALVGRL